MTQWFTSFKSYTPRGCSFSPRPRLWHYLCCDLGTDGWGGQVHAPGARSSQEASHEMCVQHSPTDSGRDLVLYLGQNFPGPGGSLPSGWSYLLMRTAHTDSQDLIIYLYYLYLGAVYSMCGFVRSGLKIWKEEVFGPFGKAQVGHFSTESSTRWVN